MSHPINRVTEVPKGICPACGQKIESGQGSPVTVTSKGHMIGLESHDNDTCYKDTEKLAMADNSWKIDPAFKA